jgi:hypothetical protein
MRVAMSRAASGAAERSRALSRVSPHISFAASALRGRRRKTRRPVHAEQEREPGDERPGRGAEALGCPQRRGPRAAGERDPEEEKRVARPEDPEHDRPDQGGHVPGDVARAREWPGKRRLEERPEEDERQEPGRERRRERRGAGGHAHEQLDDEPEREREPERPGQPRAQRFRVDRPAGAEPGQHEHRRDRELRNPRRHPATPQAGL